MIKNGYATKNDIKRLEQSTKGDIKRLEQSTKGDIKRLEQSTKGDIKKLESSTKTAIKSLEQSFRKLDKDLSQRILNSEIKILGELQKMRDDDAAHKFSHMRINDDLIEHDDRLKKVEASLQI